jgi:CBS domain containing-hemolysin-like protein
MNSTLSPFLDLISLIPALALVGLNGFFVAAEFAIVKVRRTRLEELAGQGITAARISILCIDQMDEYLSATQLGITISSLALGWIGESAFANLFIWVFGEHFITLRNSHHFIAVGFSFFMITLLHVVLGELVPKNMAIQSAEKITLWVSRPLRLFFKITRPLIFTFAFLAGFILRRIDM